MIHSIQSQVVDAILLVQRQICWKPGSANRHLQKRKERGHLTPDTTLAEYEQIIHSVVWNQTAIVYLYVYNNVPYVAVVATIREQPWLTMFGLDGVLETAFMVEYPDSYLGKFDRLGTLEDVLS